MELEKEFSKTLIVIILLALLLLGMNFYHENKINVKKQDVALSESYYMESFYDTNMVGAFLDVGKLDENNNPLNGVTFRISTFNNTYEYNVHRARISPKKDGSPNDGLYTVEDYDDNLSFAEVERALTETQVHYIHNVKTKRDLVTLFKDQYSCIDEVNDITQTAGEETIDEDAVAKIDYPSCVAYMPTYFTLEEEKVPAGYSRKKVLVPGIVMAYYRYTDDEDITDDSSLELMSINVETLPNGYHMEYGQVDRNELLDIDLAKVVKLWDRYGEISEYCYGGIAYEQPVYIPPVSAVAGVESSPFFRLENCILVIQNEKGSVNLIVTSSVNNEESITTDINQVLEYKVNVKNTGTADAIDSKVTATVPEGFIYVEGSVSHNGVYHDGVITWEVDRLDRGDNIDLTYQAYAPKGVNTYHSYVSEASVENFAVEGVRVESNKTYVKLSLVNPYTYAPIGMIILILFFAGGVMVLGLSRHAKQK